MRTAGVFLIFAAVALRGLVVLSGDPGIFPSAMGLLAAYGLLLIFETWMVRLTPQAGQAPPGRWWALAYLLLQSFIVLRLLTISGYEDFFALLFVPLSLDAVTFFGSRYGFLLIAAFSVALLRAFQFSDQGRLFGLGMAVLYAGECFLFGAYANQVQKAGAAQARNRRTLDDLLAANRRLQGYADQATSLAVEQERNRLARELHDSVTQTVFSMNLGAQSTRLLLDRDPSRAAGQLLRIEELAADAQREIQSLVTQLRPRSVSEEGLLAALERLAVERQERDGLQVALEVNCARAASEAEAGALYAIAQEALTNIARHSGARQATVRLELRTSASCLEVEDRGAGFDPAAVANRPGHLGLAGMTERAREIGWSLSVESRQGQGTRIHVAAPPAGDPQ